MKELEIERMEQTQGGFKLADCVVAGVMSGVHLTMFGPWGFVAGFAIGCEVSQL